MQVLVVSLPLPNSVEGFLNEQNGECIFFLNSKMKKSKTEIIKMIDNKCKNGKLDIIEIEEASKKNLCVCV